MPEKAKKTETIRVRCDADFKKKVRSFAGDLKLGLSAFARLALIEKMKK